MYVCTYCVDNSLPNNDSSGTAAIAGATVGAVLLISILFLIVIYCKLSQKHKKKKSANFNIDGVSYNEESAAITFYNKCDDDNNMNSIELDTVNTTSASITNNLPPSLKRSFSHSSKGSF